MRKLVLVALVIGGLSQATGCIISSDDDDENTDWVRFTAGMEGDYKVKITAYKGSGWYELTVFDTANY